ncbi:uncharacterized protein LOC131731669 isoform X2 [Acipenser ruthenus]|uniref:uncharacterized protein LOC131731669 isoform X2 n=1 Tax=Acipenser ruthenus TaxID=7906 RepID=UPI0027411738|nr:uncharacterized protein LOC131731669 isoform X2 [Acipenser ruthenus]
MSVCIMRFHKGVVFFLSVGGVLSGAVEIPVDCSEIKTSGGSYQYRLPRSLSAKTTDPSCHADWANHTTAIANWKHNHSSEWILPAVAVSADSMTSELCLSELTYALDCTSSSVSEKVVFRSSNSKATAQALWNTAVWILSGVVFILVPILHFSAVMFVVWNELSKLEQATPRVVIIAVFVRLLSLKASLMNSQTATSTEATRCRCCENTTWKSNQSLAWVSQWFCLVSASVYRVRPGLVLRKVRETCMLYFICSSGVVVRALDS